MSAMSFCMDLRYRHAAGIVCARMALGAYGCGYGVQSRPLVYRFYDRTLLLYPTLWRGYEHVQRTALVP